MRILFSNPWQWFEPNSHTWCSWTNSEEVQHKQGTKKLTCCHLEWCAIPRQLVPHPPVSTKDSGFFHSPHTLEENDRRQAQYKSLLNNNYTYYYYTLIQQFVYRGKVESQNYDGGVHEYLCGIHALVWFVEDQICRLIKSSQHALHNQINHKTSKISTLVQDAAIRSPVLTTLKHWQNTTP